MKIYTLTGKSGTGKSYHAMEIVAEHGIESIIDDGLFIYRNTVVEGESAKRATTKIGAVKTALFTDECIRDKVVAAIKEKNPASVLVLGTSDEMADRIIARLTLDKVIDDEVVRIYIDDITTEEERNRAREERNNMGKHVIPAPSLELKHNFAGYFLDPLRYIRGRDEGAAEERTVVRPSFSYMGSYIINEKAINDIIHLVVRETPGIFKVVYISHVKSEAESYSLLIAIKTRRGYPIWESSMNFQRKVQEAIETMTAFNVTDVTIEVRGVS